MTITIKFYIEAALKKGWKFEWVDEYRNVAIFYPPGEEPILIRNNVTELATAVGSTVSSLKATTTELAKQVGFDVPETIVIEEDETAQKAVPLLKSSGRLVVKPMDAAYGDGISANVVSRDMLQVAIDRARHHNIKSTGVVVQEYCEGRDFRLFILRGKLVAAIERVPLVLVGDGKSTIDDLLTDKIKSLSEREDNKVKPVKVEKTEILAHLSKHHETDVLASGERLVAQGVANLSRGGEAIDVTDEVNQDVTDLAIKLAQLLRMDMCAVDVLSDDIGKPPKEASTKFIEVNVAPGFRGHYYPAVGQKRELAPLILDAIVARRHEQKTIAKNEK